jgi:hypothetical protein
VLTKPTRQALVRRLKKEEAAEDEDAVEGAAAEAVGNETEMIQGPEEVVEAEEPAHRLS